MSNEKKSLKPTARAAANNHSSEGFCQDEVVSLLMRFSAKALKPIAWAWVTSRAAWEALDIPVTCGFC